ncbi:phosphotransferase [Mycoplasma sp. Pen4]|uniref:phosphotransferase n=1 Tax=Mycoplasma sp. Pen4 TaxID=640330 RepID=UPI0016543AAC|nr:phosphotransferase [Mycoplasma sp. Pen4]QNM93334.1 phosphotransferase [Mycoplasma sp. Pen4]
MKKELVKIGFTNKTYKTDKNHMFQEKIFNKFNHKIDYTLLENFDFVPELINETENTLEYQWIDTKPLEFSEDVLIQIADNFKTLHDSKLKFPPTNVAARVREYRKVLQDKGIKIDAINDNFKRINSILKNSENNRPLHNDLYKDNILLDKNGKVFFIDWEYASMGDKHFDLAYFICGSFLTPKQEKIFLDRYDTYWEEYLIQQKILVYYLTILWVNAQDVKHFDDAPLIQKLNETIELFNYKKETKTFRD